MKRRVWGGLSAMVGIDISKLGVDELRRLSRLAQARGQTALADAIAGELRARPLRAHEREPAPLSPFPATAPTLPATAAARVAPRGRSRPVWALALVGALALILGWGVTLPEGRILDVGFGVPEVIALTQAPLAEALCTARSVLGETRDCGPPKPLGEMTPAT